MRNIFQKVYVGFLRSKLFNIKPIKMKVYLYSAIDRKTYTGIPQENKEITNKKIGLDTTKNMYWKIYIKVLRSKQVPSAHNVEDVSFRFTS
jgi:hypothetical protein